MNLLYKRKSVRAKGKREGQSVQPGISVVSYYLNGNLILKGTYQVMNNYSPFIQNPAIMLIEKQLCWTLFLVGMKLLWEI